MELKATTLGKRLAQHPYDRAVILNAGIKVSGDRHEYLIPFNQLLAIHCKRCLLYTSTQAQHAVVRTSTDGVCVTDVVGPLVFQTGSDFRSDRVLNTASENRRNAGVVVFKRCATRYVSLGVCTPYHTTQTLSLIHI